MEMPAVSKKILESSQDFKKGEREQGQRLGQSFQTAGNLAKKGWGGAALWVWVLVLVPGSSQYRG